MQPKRAGLRVEMAGPGGRHYFAYGSNMDVRQMGRRCPGARLIGRARLEGYRFILNSCGVATIVRREPGRVHGVLWKIAGADERALDAYEGIEEGLYRKEVLEVQAPGGNSLPALVYIAADASPAASRSGYMEEIVASAEAHGLPEEYLDELSSWLKAGGQPW